MQAFSDAKVYKTNDGEIGLKPQGESWVIWFNGCWWNAKYKVARICGNCIHLGTTNCFSHNEPTANDDASSCESFTTESE